MLLNLEVRQRRAKALMKQLPLPIQPAARTGFDNFVSGSNATIVASLRELFADSPEQQIFLWSTKVSGKTHILQALCHEASERGFRSAYLPLNTFTDRSPELLEGMEFMDLLCLDDVHSAFGKTDWEEALFDLINRCRESHCSLVFASSEQPLSHRVNLPDLRSRLMWGPVFKMNELNEQDKLEFLVQWGELRGLEIEPSAASFLLERSQRDLESLNQSLSSLDQESLAQQRKLTVPFIKSVLGL